MSIRRSVLGLLVGVFGVLGPTGTNATAAPRDLLASLWDRPFLADRADLDLARQLQLLEGDHEFAIDGVPAADREEVALEIRLRRIGRLTQSTQRYADVIAPLERFLETERAPLVAAIAKSILAHAHWRTGQLDRAHSRWSELGWIDHWQVIGPFENERGSGFQVAQPVESDPDLTREHDGKRGRVAWREVPHAGRTDGVDLRHFMTPAEDVLAYLQSAVHSDEARDAVLRVSSSGSYAIWLNGIEVARRDVEREFRLDQDTIAVRLGAGWNRLLIKSATTQGTWGFRVRITDAAGTSLGLRQAMPIPSGEAEADAVPPGVFPIDEGAITRLASIETAPALFLRGWITAERSSHDHTDHPDRALFRRAHETTPSALALYYWASTFTGTITHEAQREENRWRRGLEELLELDEAFARARLDLAAYYWERFRNASFTRQHLESYERWVAGWNIEPSLRALDLRYEWTRREISSPAALAITLELERSDRFDPRLVLQNVARLASRGELEAALRTIESGLSHDALSLRMTRANIELLRSTGQVEAAREEWRRLCLGYGTEPQLFFEWSRFESDHEDWIAALAAIERAIALDPGSERALEARGRILLALDRRAEGLADFRRSLELEPNQPRLREYTELLAETETTLADEHRLPVDASIASARGVESSENDPYRVILDNTAVALQDDGTTKRYRQLLFQALNDTGVRALDAYPVQYAFGEQWVRVLKARVHHPDGSTEDARIRNRDPQVREGEYPVWSTAWIDVPPLRAGSVLEIEYLQEDLKQSFFGDYFGDTVVFSQRVPVERARYTLTAPAGKALYFHRRGLDVEAEVTTKDGRRTWQWDVRNPEKINEEVAMPPLQEVGASLQVSTFRDWDAFARWYHHLIRKQFESSDAIRAKVAELTEGLESEQEKIRAIYEFVVTEVRYIAWEFGVHGFKPYKASTIFDRRFGDCKDKATLICTMLDELGIDAFPVLVEGTRQREVEDFTLPLVSHFNHCIAYIPSMENDGSAGSFVDGTAEHHPFGTLPEMDYGAKVLVVKDDGSDIVDIPWNRPEERQIDEEMTVTLEDDGSASVVKIDRLTGEFATSVRAAFEIEGERKVQLERILAQRYPGVKVDRVETSPLDDLSAPVWIRIEFSVPKYLEKAADGLKLPELIDLFASTSSVERWISREERQWALSLGNPMRSRLRVQVDLPPSLRVAATPDPVDRTTDFGQFRFETERDGRRLLIEQDFTVSSPRVPAAEYATFRELIESVLETGDARIRLEKTKEIE